MEFRIDLFTCTKEHYMTYFPEKWLAMAFAEKMESDETIESIFLLGEPINGKYDVLDVIK